MSPKIFITGATGYIGGSILHTLSTTHPSYTITCLLRKTPPTFRSTYPNVTIIEGDYDNTSLLTSTASASDIVIHNGDSDHVASLKAILAGLLEKQTPGTLIHLSGTGIISDWESPDHLGRLNPKIWSDTSLTDLDTIRNLPPSALHRPTEALLHKTITSNADKINIAIICPPDIYGTGLGPGKKHSALIPMYVSECLKLGAAFYHEEGANMRSWVHINDLMSLYSSLVDIAVSTPPNDSTKYFNTNGYYFAATQSHAHLSLATSTGAILHKHGVIADPVPKQVGLETLDQMANLPGFPKLARYLFASNARTGADRAGEVFGYRAKAEDLMKELEGDCLAALGKA